MGGFIKLPSGDTWSAPTWAYRHLSREIIESLDSNNDKEIIDYINNQEKAYVHIIDLGYFNSNNQEKLINAIIKSNLRIQNSKPKDLRNSEVLNAHKLGLSVLIDMIEEIKETGKVNYKGKPKYVFNSKHNMR